VDSVGGDYSVKTTYYPTTESFDKIALTMPSELESQASASN